MFRYETGHLPRQNRRKSYMKFEQKQALLEFIKKHHELYFGKYSSTFTVKQSRELWQEIANSLNRIPGGTHKTWYQWRKAWQDLKTKNRLGLNMGRDKFEAKARNSNKSLSEDDDVKSNDDAEYEDISDPIVQFVECDEHESLEYLEDCKDDVNEALKHCMPENSTNYISHNTISKTNEQTENSYVQDSNYEQEEGPDRIRVKGIPAKIYKSPSKTDFREEYYKKKLALMERDVIAKERIAFALENLQFH